MNYGHRIKQLRIKQGLTLEELADRCELTKGFLSQLERNLTYPSIQTLEDITEALGTSMSDFFKEESDEKIAFKVKDFFIKETDEHTIKWIVPNSQKNMMEPIILEVQPKCKSMIINPHNGEEFGLVLSGKFQIVMDSKKKISIKKGETFYLDGNNEHYLLNTSDTVSKVLWICTPPIF